MKILLLSGAMYSIPSMHFLHSQKMLDTVVSLGKTNKHNVQVAHTAGFLNVPYRRFLKDELLTNFKTLLTETAPDMVLVFGCAYKIPAELFTIPRLGFYNVHFSLLPAYRGRCPVFWQLKNGETGGITIHRLAGEFDTGPILLQHELPTFPGETHGLYSGRLSLESAGLIAKAIEKLQAPSDDMLIEQNQNTISYAPAPGANDLMIDWETQSAKEIENLVNAANPDYDGAITSLRGQPVRILEVNPAQVNNPGEFMPGTIVHSDTNYGVFVACKDQQFLRINVVRLTEGVFSGLKLAGIGIAAGERFESAAGLASFKVMA